ncbi:hypothetical protein GCM10027570_01360 [Streptomonospora sediminis]
MSADGSASASGRPNAAKAFDIRTVIGLLFVIYGAVLTVMGIFASPEQIEHSGGANLNLWSGVGMLVFGLLMGAWAMLMPLQVPDDQQEQDKPNS